MCKSLLEGHVGLEDLNIICNAIKNHSDKHLIHDDYSELLKDADILASYYESKDNVIKDEHYQRIKKYIEKRDEE